MITKISTFINENVSLDSVHKLIPRHQMSTILANKKEFKEVLKDLSDTLINIPQLYAQDGKGKNAIVYAHYFSASSDWYITEYDAKTNQAFGLVYMHGDSELGYISISELTSNNRIELDFYFTPTTLGEIKAKKG